VKYSIQFPSISPSGIASNENDEIGPAHISIKPNMMAGINAMTVLKVMCLSGE